jgi:N-acetylglucosamine-6-sulfatase
MNNLLSNYNITRKTVPEGTLLNYPLSKVVPRLDALLLVLKSCKGSTCTNPWRWLHPQGNVNSLPDALSSRYDDFYNSQPKVMFTACKLGYLIQYEGPQTALRYGGG